MQPILTVNLTSGTIGQFSVSKEFEQSYLGGATLAARLLYDSLTPELDPLSPAAPLLFMTGPLTGTAGPSVGRFVVCAKSPATGLWGESNCGGFWGPELRMAGYDGLLVTGRAPQPVYLWIQDGHAEICKADNLWGLDPYQTQAILGSELNQKNLRVASIGIGGEAQIPMSSILCDHGRMAGRTGMGAVMGSKQLKAVAVKGTGKVPVFDAARYNPLRAEVNRNLRSDSVSQMFHSLGSAGGAEYLDFLGDMPKRYFHDGRFEGELKITGANVAETILVGTKACHACVIACGRVVRLEDGEERKGPEYETLVGFGPNLGLNDPATATRLGELCDRYGLDIISLSNTIGLAFTLYEQRILTSMDTGGLELIWGDAEVITQLVHWTAHREGFGAFLAEGARSLARRFNAEDEAVQVNGLEVAYHDPRGSSGMALVYATSPRGACHNQSDYFIVEMGQVDDTLGMEFHLPQGGAEKAANVARHQNWRTLFNSLVMCTFANVPSESLLNLVNAACGVEWTIQDALQAGERGWNLKRVINNRLGLTRSNDRLPKLLLEPYSDGAANGFTPDLIPMLEAYYAVRDWDATTGYPTAEKLVSLGLQDSVDDLYQRSRS